MRLLKWTAYVLLCLGGVLVVMVVIGAFVSEQHTVSVTAELPASQQLVWQLLTDVDSQPKWRTDLKSVVHLPDEQGHPCWVEVRKHLRMTLCADLSTPESRRVVRIADPNLPFSGDWTYELTPATTNSTRLTITENGTVEPALWRFLDYFVFGQDSNIRQFESDLLKATKQ